MNKSIERRVIDGANIIINTKITLRELSKRLGYSKSTLHKDMQERLPLLDQELYEEVRNIFNEHIKLRHYLGGLATQNKYRKINSK